MHWIKQLETSLGVVHILRLQDEVGRWGQKCPLFVNAGRYVVKKRQNLVNVVCERPLINKFQAMKGLVTATSKASQPERSVRGRSKTIWTKF